MHSPGDEFREKRRDFQNIYRRPSLFLRVASVDAVVGKAGFDMLKERRGSMRANLKMLE
jgi:hypothetical protein